MGFAVQNWETVWGLGRMDLFAESEGEREREGERARERWFGATRRMTLHYISLQTASWLGSSSISSAEQIPAQKYSPIGASSLMPGTAEHQAQRMLKLQGSSSGKHGCSETHHGPITSHHGFSSVSTSGR